MGDAARAFAAALAATRKGPIVWIQIRPARGRPAERLDPYGLAGFVDPARLILIEAKENDDAFWAMEEALRSGAAPTVVAECAAPPDLTRSRRLQLAAEAGAGAAAAPVGLGLIPDAAVSNAAETRWRATAAPSVWTSAPVSARAGPPLVDPARSAMSCADPAPSPVGPRTDAPPPEQPLWRWRLDKNKRGPTGDWLVRWRGPRRSRPDAPNRAAGRAQAEDGSTHGSTDRLRVVAALRGGAGAAA